MNKFIEVGLIIIAAGAVAVADVLIKKAAIISSGFSAIWKSPLMLEVIALYLLQIIIFAYVFVKRAELGVVGVVQIALYAAIVVGSGVLFFKEDISFGQGIGMFLALLGVAIIYLY